MGKKSKDLLCVECLSLCQVLLDESCPFKFELLIKATRFEITHSATTSQQGNADVLSTRHTGYFRPAELAGTVLEYLMDRVNSSLPFHIYRTS
jgi:hypothetical protein